MSYAASSLRPVVLISLLIAVAVPLAPQSALAGAETGLCARAVAAVERDLNVPRMLLHAVSLAESGRWVDRRQASIAWPWTVTAGGKGRFFPDRKAAIAAVKRLRADGVKNIDVGCMQVNLRYHPDAFASLDEAFDPETNTEYAARFLQSLRRTAGSWAHAVGRYHTTNWEKRGQDYWRRVYRLWNSERRRDFEVRRAARIAAYRRNYLAAQR